MRQLYVDSRAWMGIAAIALAAFTAGGALAMSAEASSGSTCFLRTCDGAHIPGPFALIWMFALVAGHYLAFGAFVVASVEVYRLVRRRAKPRADEAAVVLVGPIAVVAVWLAMTLLLEDAPPLAEWVVSRLLGVVLVPFMVLSTGYLWVGGVATGVVLLVRRETPVLPAAGIMALSIASGAYGIWVVHFNDGAWL